jgi:hypothetical protein
MNTQIKLDLKIGDLLIGESEEVIFRIITIYPRSVRVQNSNAGVSFEIFKENLPTRYAVCKKSNLDYEKNIAAFMKQ